MAIKMQKVCIITQTLLLILLGSAVVHARSKGEKIYEKMQEEQDMINDKVNGYIWDNRPNTTLEKVLQFIFYLPLSLGWFVVTVFSAIMAAYTLLKWLCHNQTPSEEECKVVDNHTLNQIKLVTLDRLNKQRGDKKLTFGMFMQSYMYLNWRTDFEADDVFSQKSAILAHIYRIRTNPTSYIGAGVINTDINMEDDEDENYEKLNKLTKKNIQKALSFKRLLTVMCFLSLFTSALALSLIFNELLIQQTRKIVLSSFFNAILRICFGAIILCIAQRDMMQIIVNLSVRLTGSVSEADNSRWVFVEAILRISLTTLALITILFVVFSTPNDEYEGIIDQTMNFTALVILLEIDNILASVFQAKIDNLKVDFEQNPDTLEFEFNRCADFLQGRKGYYYCQYYLELLFLQGFAFILFLVVTIMPIFMLMLYVVIPPHAASQMKV